MSIRDRIRLAKILGVAPDDVDYIALVSPPRRAAHIVAHYGEVITDDEFNDLVVDIMTTRERNAYDRVIGVVSKYSI